MTIRRSPDLDVDLLLALRRKGGRMTGECENQAYTLRCLNFKEVFSLKSLLTSYVPLKKCWSLRGFLKK